MFGCSSVMRGIKGIFLVLLIVTAAGCGGSDGGENNEDTRDRFAEFWDELERLDPRPDWWRDSEPYTCRQEENPDSPWPEAGLEDLGGSDPLSLIRWFGNGSYLRYGNLRFFGCTELEKYPGEYHVADTPVDPTYYSLGDLDIYVDIAHVPPRPAHVPADEWWTYEDDGERIDDFSMEEAVSLLNQHVAPYYRRISGDRFRITFHAGNEFEVGVDGQPEDAEDQQMEEAGITCGEGCRKYGPPSGLNRILLNDVASYSGGEAASGWAGFGLVSFRDELMEVIVHEIGHGWMEWPHSFTEVVFELPDQPTSPPNEYSNPYDVMSSFSFIDPVRGWDSNMPSTLAINRYSSGWISPGDVALHTKDEATYTLSKPFDSGYQFLVIHSGRRYAFTTLEVLEERSSRYKLTEANVYDPSAPDGRRPRRYEGVLVSRYDQSAGTGGFARSGPALYNTDNPNYRFEVGGGVDDYSLIPDGGTRQIGGGVSVSVRKNPDGSYEVTVSGGKTAEFKKWCVPILLSLGDGKIEYDTGCSLEPEF